MACEPAKEAWDLIKAEYYEASTRNIACKPAKEASDLTEAEYYGSEKSRRIQVLKGVQGFEDVWITNIQVNIQTKLCKTVKVA